jgi:CheY-like chemotaxis protein
VASSAGGRYLLFSAHGFDSFCNPGLIPFLEVNRPGARKPDMSDNPINPCLLENDLTALRILIADDHDLLRRGVKALLQSHPGWEICGEARTGREAVAKAEELKPDIVILDFSMPDLDGLEAARRIRKASANTEVLILSVHHSDQLIREILEAGVRGYVVKSDSDRDLIIAV